MFNDNSLMSKGKQYKLAALICLGQPDIVLRIESYLDSTVFD